MEIYDERAFGVAVAWNLAKIQVAGSNPARRLAGQFRTDYVIQVCIIMI